MHHTRLLEVHNQQLQSSLFDIAQIVLDDADREDSAAVPGALAGGDLSTTNTSFIRSSSTNPLVRVGRYTSTSKCIRVGTLSR